MRLRLLGFLIWFLAILAAGGYGGWQTYKALQDLEWKVISAVVAATMSGLGIFFVLCFVTYCFVIYLDEDSGYPADINQA